MPSGGKTSKDKPKPATQSRLTDFGKSEQAPAAMKEANANIATGILSPAANAEAPEQETSSAAKLASDKGQLHLVKEEIVNEIRHLKAEFSGRFDGVLKAIEETRKEVTECEERVLRAEGRLTGVEMEQGELKMLIETLQKRNKRLEDQTVDLEMRSRLNNLRLVGVPENAEGPDMCGFLESWIPDALELNPMRQPLVLERAHRVGPKRDADAPPRTIIMRFLNYKQKEIIMKTARTKKEILYKDQRVRFYADVATEVHKRRKQFDAVREELRRLGVRHGIISPSTLVLTYEERVFKFNSPAEAKVFVAKIRQTTL